MIGIVTAAAEAVEQTAKKFETNLFLETKRAFSDITQKFQSRFTEERLTKSGSPLGGSDRRKGVFRRSGDLARGFVTRVTGDNLKTLEGAVGWWQPFQAMKAGVHEYGATITPKRSSYLAIPLDAVLTNTGRARYGYGPRDWPDTRIHKSKSGHLFIVQDQPGQELLPLYILKKSVTLPARLGFRAMWNSKAHQLAIQRRLNRSVKEALRSSVQYGRGFNVARDPVTGQFVSARTQA